MPRGRAASFRRRACAHCFTCHACAECVGVAFETKKQLLAHQRAKHGHKNAVVSLIGDTSICPVCGNDFRSRLRLITHLSETRVRSKHRSCNCRSMFLASDPPSIAASVLTKLNLADQKARHHANKCGHSHVIATLPAKLSISCKLNKAGNLARKRIRGKTLVSQTSLFYKHLQRRQGRGC